MVNNGKCWMQNLKSKNIAEILGRIRQATAKDLCLSKTKLCAEMQMQGLSEKSFENYFEILIKQNLIKVDGDDVLAVIEEKQKISEEIAEEFENVIQ